MRIKYTTPRRSVSCIFALRLSADLWFVMVSPSPQSFLVSVRKTIRLRMPVMMKMITEIAPAMP